MKPISQEKRELILSANERGEKAETISVWVGVAVSSVYNILRLRKEKGDITPKPYPGKASSLTEEHLIAIRKTVAEQNDITLEELIEKLDLPIKKSRLSVVLIDMGLSFKKRHFTQAVNNAKMSKKNVRNGVRRSRA
jgi:transposase